MATKRACVLHIAELKSAAEEVAKRLTQHGYEVCVTEVTGEAAKAVKAGEKTGLPADVADCLDGAEVCIVLVDEQGSLAAIGGIASDDGCRVVTVGGSPDDLPQELDDVVDGHVPQPDTPDLIDIVDGEDILISRDGTRKPPRKPKRVKCQ